MADPNAMFLTWSCAPRNCLEFLKSRGHEDTILYELLVEHGANFPTLIDMGEKYPEKASYIAEAVVSAGNYADAIELISHLIKKKPESVLHYQRGVAYDMTQKTDEALADFDAAIQLEPNNFEALYSRSLVRRKQGKWQESLADLEAGIKVNPSDYITANALASMLLRASDENMRDPKRAMELAIGACKLSDWKDAICVETLSEAYRALGDNAKADETAQKASDLRDRDALTQVTEFSVTWANVAQVPTNYLGFEFSEQTGRPLPVNKGV